MKLFFSIFFFLILAPRNANSQCYLERELVNFSGPMAMLLEEFDLLGDQKLIATTNQVLYSSSHQAKYKHKIIPGGLYLPQKTLQQFTGKFIFYDEAKELKALFNKTHPQSATALSTLGLSPDQTILYLIEKLSDFLNIKSCQKLLIEWKERIKKLNNTIHHVKNPEILFFMGQLGVSHYPEYLIVNDGIPLYLKQTYQWPSYPGPHAYVVWSEKILKEYERRATLFVGFDEHAEENVMVNKVAPNKYNVFYRGIFIPGVRQWKFLENFPMSIFSETTKEKK